MLLRRPRTVHKTVRSASGCLAAAAERALSTLQTPWRAKGIQEEMRIDGGTVVASGLGPKIYDRSPRVGWGRSKLSFLSVSGWSKFSMLLEIKNS